jgi:hypothetical protein
MMASLVKQQEGASPWAFVAFEAEGTEPAWEAYEPEPIRTTAFAPIEDAPVEATKAPLAGGQAALHNQVTVTASNEERCYTDQLHFEERLQELEQSHQGALVDLERKFAVELLDRLAAQIDAQGRKLADEFGARLLCILAPVLMDHARKASLAALTRDLQRIFISGEVNKIVLSGPQDLAAQIQSELGEQASRLRVEHSDSVDVTVRIDSEVLATKLSAWASVLKDVVA